MSSALARLRSRRGATTGAGAAAGEHRHLLTGSAVLVVGAGIQAVTGFLYWLVAAKLDTKTDVGNATAMYTSMLFAVYLAGLGLPVALARYAGDRSRASEVVFSWGTLATLASSFFFSLAYYAVILRMNVTAATELRDLNPVLGPLLFAIMVAGAALSLIVDVRCMTLRRWNLVVARIAIVGIVRLPFVFLLRNSPDRAVWLFAMAAGTTMLSGLIGAWLVPRVGQGRHHLTPKPATAHAALRYSAINYLSTLGYQAPYFALPVIVLTSVDADTNAGFYVAWGIVSVVFYVPSAIGQALLAEGGKDGAHLRSQTRMSLVLAVSLMVAGTVAAVFGSGVVETLYGAKYHDAAHILPAMMAAGIPWAITSIELTEARVRHRNVVTVLITLVLTLAIIVPALVLVPGHHGPHAGAAALDGAAKAWLFGNIFAALVALIAARVGGRADVLPSVDPVLRVDTGDPTTPTASPSPAVG